MRVIGAILLFVVGVLFGILLTSSPWWKVVLALLEKL